MAALAGRQHARITSAQLHHIGLTDTNWTYAGYLHRRLRGVYAVGTPARTTESDRFEAVLYAGPGAMLSHVTGAWWLGLIDHPSPLIHVSTPRRRTSPCGILVHKRRIAHYGPRLAFTHSPLENDWLICCEQLAIPKPDDVNVEICGIPVDACYYDAKLIIELDGIDNHRSPLRSGATGATS